MTQINLHNNDINNNKNKSRPHSAHVGRNIQTTKKKPHSGMTKASSSTNYNSNID
jgi:hypothetical protein